MSTYTVSVVAVTVACATALMIASGTRYEKLCAALTAVAVALCVISPIKEILSDDTKIFANEITEEAQEGAERTVIAECENTVARRAAAALADKFPGVGVGRLEVTVSKEGGAYVVTSYKAELSGENSAAARQYLEVILGLR